MIKNANLIQFILFIAGLEMFLFTPAAFLVNINVSIIMLVFGILLMLSIFYKEREE